MVIRYFRSIIWIRAFAVICIVLLHSNDLWSISGVGGFDVRGTSFDRVSSILKFVGLFSFFFISGFLFENGNQKGEPIHIIIKKKFYRLGIPCLFWGVLYLITYSHYCSETVQFSICSTNYSFPLPILGSHLWFLPVLLLCSITLALINETRYSGWLVLSFIIALYYFHLRPFYSSTYLWQYTHYCPVFLVGSLMKRYQSILDMKWGGVLLILLWVSALCIKFVFDKNMYGLVNVGCVLPVLLFFIREEASRNKEFYCPNIIRSISENSYGIYLIHQFIINFFVIQLHITELVHGNNLVLVLFFASFFISLLLTQLVRKSPLKPIIGL